MHLRLAFLPGLEPATRRSADRRATDRATREGFIDSFKIGENLHCAYRGQPLERTLQCRTAAEAALALPPHRVILSIKVMVRSVPLALLQCCRLLLPTTCDYLYV